jgi:hypothetical protein
MSNAKLPAPNDLIQQIVTHVKAKQSEYREGSAAHNVLRDLEVTIPGLFTPKPLQVEGPTRDDKRCVLQCAMGPWEPSVCPGEKCIGEAGAEATGKSDELTMNKFVDKYLTYAYSRQHTGDMWTLTLEKVWKEVIEPLLSNKKA